MHSPLQRSKRQAARLFAWSHVVFPLRLTTWSSDKFHSACHHALGHKEASHTFSGNHNNMALKDRKLAAIVLAPTPPLIDPPALADGEGVSGNERLGGDWRQQLSVAAAAATAVV